MYFLPKNNRWYSFIVSLHPLYRYVLTLFVFASVLIIWLFCFYFPLQRSIVQYHNMYKQIRKQKKEIDLAEITSNNITHLVRDIDEKFASYRTKQFDNHIHAYLIYMIENAHKLGLHLEDYTTAHIVDKSWYKKQKVESHMMGSFAQIKQFLELLRDSEKMITVQQLRMELVEPHTYKLDTQFSFIAVN